MPPKTPKYQRKASATYKERREAEGYKRASVSFWVKKLEEKEFKKRISAFVKSLKSDKK